MTRLRVYHDDSSSKGIGFTGLLQIAFIVLKLCNVIKWSWWCVFLPTLIPMGLMVLAVLIALVWPIKD